MLYTKEEKFEKAIKVLKVILIMLLVIIMCTAPVLAWFYANRSVVGATKVSNPIALYINAANKEDVQYIDLSEIDVTEGSYNDYVFCVNGKYINSYGLQLAHTTNNQFTYEIYTAHLATQESDYASAFTTVEYTTHPTSTSISAVDQVYYVNSSSDLISGRYLNSTTSDGLTLGIIDSNNSYYTNTYEGYGLVNKYAMPMYWQPYNSISTGLDSANFTHYYVLRISWGENAENNKETDIIYIAAQAVS